MEVTVDLVAQRVAAGGYEATFNVDSFNRECLLNGWDEVAITLRQDPDITRYEATRPGWLPSSR